MAKKSKKPTKSGSRTYLSVYGIPEMVDRIEKALGDPKEALDRAYRRGMDQPETVMEDWFEYIHHRTGRTRRSYVRGKLVWTKGGYAEYRYGFDKKEGGLPAVFFEYGTPRIKPEFVMWYAVKGAVDVIESEMTAEMRRILEERGLA